MIASVLFFSGLIIYWGIGMLHIFKFVSVQDAIFNMLQVLVLVFCGIWLKLEER